MSGWAAALSTGGDMFSAWANNRAAMARQHDADNFSGMQFASRYTQTVRDLKNAGLNPMLAYTQGGGSPPSGSTASPGTMHANPVGAYNETRLASAQEGKLIAETSNIRATERNTEADTLIKSGMPDLIAAQVVQAHNSAEQSGAMVKKIQAETGAIDTEIKNLESQIAKNKSDVNANNSLIELNKYRAALTTAEMYLTNNNAEKSKYESLILSPKAKAARTTTAELGATADNIGKIGSAAWKFMFPTLNTP
ncbi:MAG: DNA pilot protein [Microvirus sp.]|nr:MAG: DNA pilot protein [Microvirus sp.]